MKNLFNQDTQILGSENFYFSPIDQDSLYGLHDLFSDPLCAKYISSDNHKSMIDTELYLNKIVQDFEAMRAIYFGLHTVPLGDFVGFVALHHFDETAQTCKIGYGIRRKYQRKGYAVSAISKVVNHAFLTSSLQKIIASVELDNEPSIKLLEASGFSCERSLTGTSYNPRTGKIEDRMLFSVTRP